MALLRGLAKHSLFLSDLRWWHALQNALLDLIVAKEIAIFDGTLLHSEDLRAPRGGGDGGGSRRPAGGGRRGGGARPVVFEPTAWNVPVAHIDERCATFFRPHLPQFAAFVRRHFRRVAVWTMREPCAAMPAVEAILQGSSFALSSR